MSVPGRYSVPLGMIGPMSSVYVFQRVTSFSYYAPQNQREVTEWAAPRRRGSMADFLIRKLRIRSRRSMERFVAKWYFGFGKSGCAIDYRLTDT
jgi:hypothetical protein